MLQPVNVWPLLELTPQEREFVGHYASPTKPGVLRRSYGTTLRISNIAGDPQQPAQLVTFSGRRVRIFGLTFSGDLGAWLLQLSSPAGTLYTNGLVSVASLLNREEDLTGPNMLPEWEVSQGSPRHYLDNQTSTPLLFDPNIVIEGTDALIFSGQLGASWLARAGTSDYRAVLNVGIHVWEFPEWPRERPFVGPGNKTVTRAVAGTR